MPPFISQKKISINHPKKPGFLVYTAKQMQKTETKFFFEKPYTDSIQVYMGRSRTGFLKFLGGNLMENMKIPKNPKIFFLNVNESYLTS